MISIMRVQTLLAFLLARTHPPSPDLKHSITFNHPPWVQQELRRRGLQPLVSPTDADITDGDFRFGKENGTIPAQRVLHKAPQVEEEAGLTCPSIKQKQSIHEDIALVASLKACAKQKDICKGSRIHANILRRGLLEKNTHVGSALVSMYAKCGALPKAQQTFNELPMRDVVAWNSLIAGYAQHGHGQEAFSCFEQMRGEGFFPDAITFTCIASACGSVGAADKGEEIHEEVVRQGLLDKDIVLGNALVDMYAKCGALAKAQQLFNELPVRDVVTWNVLITGYAQQGHGEEALTCFEQMQWEGPPPDSVTFAGVIKACGNIGATEKGKAIHQQIVREGLLKNNLVLGSALVDMYAKCGALPKAQQVFDELPTRNVLTWTALIAGYSQQGHGKQALTYYEQMRSEGISPDPVTLACVIKACGSIGALEKGREIHAEIAKEGLMEKNPMLGSALVDMYAKCGALAKSREVFDELPVRNLGTWNSLITAYAQCGHGDEALNCYKRMRHEDLSPDAVTFVCVLKACGSIGAVEEGNKIHAEIAREGLLGTDVVLATALMDMYAKCGALAKTQEIFDELKIRDAVTWTTLIAGYVQHGHGEEALTYFEEMRQVGISPDAVTFACALSACGIVGGIEKGSEIHAEIARQGLLERHTVLGSALVDMYAKCGALTKAQQVFDELPVQDVVSWTALIAGYAQHGHDEKALNCFEQMQGEGLSPDSVTFIVLLHACCHSGLVDAGEKYFATMSTQYGIIPTLEHCTCMIDLYGRAGHFDKALEVVRKMPSSHLPVWSALLGACQKWGNVKYGRLAFEHVEQLHEKSASAYVCMSNIYAAAGMEDIAAKI